MNNSQLINQDSGNYEYYTPSSIIEAARATMGSIDLDPASSAKANQNVLAKHYFDKFGEHQNWFGNVWLNHPFSRENNTVWIAKLVADYKQYSIKQACCITYASTSEKWFQPMLSYTQCWLSPRTNYYLPDGTLKVGVTKGSVVTYLGPNKQAFYDNFKHLGKITIPYV